MENGKILRNGCFIFEICLKSGGKIIVRKFWYESCKSYKVNKFYYQYKKIKLFVLRFKGRLRINCVCYFGLRFRGRVKINVFWKFGYRFRNGFRQNVG